MQEIIPLIRLAVLHFFWQSLVNLALFITAAGSRFSAIFLIFMSFSGDKLTFLNYTFLSQELQLLGIMLWGFGYVVQTGRRFFVISWFDLVRDRSRDSEQLTRLPKDAKNKPSSRVVARVGLGFYLFIFAQFCLALIYFQSGTFIVIVLAMVNFLILWQLLYKTQLLILNIQKDATRSEVRYLSLGVWGGFSGLAIVVGAFLLLQTGVSISSFTLYLPYSFLFFSSFQLLSVLRPN
jgi:hypothetical protein